MQQKVGSNESAAFGSDESAALGCCMQLGEAAEDFQPQRAETVSIRLQSTLESAYLQDA